MANEHNEFWFALLAKRQDMDQRIRLWNGYLGWRLPPRVKGECEPQSGWSQLIVDPPDGGWPQLTGEEYELIEALAEANCGHPEFGHDYMNFSGKVFPNEVDLSGLIFVGADFNGATFNGGVKLSEKTPCGPPWMSSTSG